MTKRTQQPFDVRAGDLVLIGGSELTTPADWFIAKALWVGDQDVVTEHVPPSGHEPYRQLLSRSLVRAAGDYIALRNFQDNCRSQTKDLVEKVHEAEQAIAQARRAVWDRLEALNAATPVRLEPADRVALAREITRDYERRFTGPMVGHMVGG
ncbi:MAG: hypothetical protein AB7I42_26500 [Bradyrhizobium sp.]|uniref:hypothetical protein n=1 Tax=Bradyrhizobium sp. TaxID=376 RepID=UPI003D137B8B